MLACVVMITVGAAVEPMVSEFPSGELPPAHEVVDPLVQSVRAGSWIGQRAPCEPPPSLPRLRVVDAYPSPLPLEDLWQVTWGDIALSDAQLARLARDPALIALTSEEMESRGTWVYIGMGVAAAGAAISSTGWVLYGQNQISQEVTIPIAVGGLLVGVLGVLLVSESIQSPLEPHLAPTPKHRITRPQAEALVQQVNARLYADLCKEQP